MRGINEDEICDFVELTKHKVCGVWMKLETCSAYRSDEFSGSKQANKNKSHKNICENLSEH